MFDYEIMPQRLH